MSTLLVRKNGSGTHTTIQSAIFDSVDGDIIDIGPGLFEENVELYKSVTLQGAGKESTHIKGKLQSDVFTGASFYAGEDLISVVSSASMIRGRRITGLNLTANSRISQIISDTQIKLSLPTSTTGVITKVIVSLVTGSQTITLPNTTGVVVGTKVQGQGVEAIITALNTTTKVATLSSPISQDGSNITLTFRPLRSNVTLTIPSQFSGSSFPATIQIMNFPSNGISIKQMMITGFDGNTGTEAAAVSLTSPAAGSHENWLIDDCKIIADGDQAITSSSNLKSINGTIQNCLFDGKTFIGEEPAEIPAFSTFARSGIVTAVTANSYSVELPSLIGVVVGSTATSLAHAATATITAISGNVVTFNKTTSLLVGNSVDLTFTNVQFIIPNAARQMVVIGNSGSVTACLNTTFKNNVVNGRTGAIIASSGNKSMFNTAVTIDTVGGLIENNVVNGYFGAGDPNPLISNFAIRSRRLDTATSQTIIRNNTNDIRGGRKNSGFYFPGGMVVAENNTTIMDSPLVLPEQEAPGQSVLVTMDVSSVKGLPKVVGTPSFSDEAEWELVTFIYKKEGSSKRLVASFRDFDSEKSMKLRPGMLTGDVFQLHKIIISKESRQLLVVKRSEIEGAAGYDFTLL